MENSSKDKKNGHGTEKEERTRQALRGYVL